MTEPKPPTEADRDPRSDLEQAVQARSDAADAAAGTATPAPDDYQDATGGAGGNVKNQADAAQ